MGMIFTHGIRAAARQYDVALDGIEVVDAFAEVALAALIADYTAKYPLNSAKTMRRKAKDPMYTALMMQAAGQVDVTFAGLTHSTGDVIMAGQMVVGLQEGVSTISSVGIFHIPGYEGCEGTGGLRPAGEGGAGEPQGLRHSL